MSTCCEDWRVICQELEEKIESLESKETTESIGQWALETFGVADPEAVILRAQEELDETLDTLKFGQHIVEEGILEEAADVVIVLCQLSAVLNLDLWQAVEDKMVVNRARKWNVKDGIGQHIEDSEPLENVE